MDQYRVLELIGEGTYGKVYKAQHRQTGHLVAIKRFKQSEDEDSHSRKIMEREMKVLKLFDSPHLVQLHSHFREKDKLLFVFDYEPKNLLEELQQNENGIDPRRVKEITYQICKSIQIMHGRNVMHRDIKPENLLISEFGVVKLCDFGFARGCKNQNRQQFTDYVSTRWYRAPELLAGDAVYNNTVDVWAIGCVFAEISNGQPLFPGESDLHTLQLIMETITAEDRIRGLPPQSLSKKQRVAFKMNSLFEGAQIPHSDCVEEAELNNICLSSFVSCLDEVQLDFLRKCLVIDGAERCSIDELLEHHYFDAEFKAGFAAKFEEMLEGDREVKEQQMQEQLCTKSGRSEIPSSELFNDSESEKNSESERQEESSAGEEDDPHQIVEYSDESSAGPVNDENQDPNFGIQIDEPESKPQSYHIIKEVSQNSTLHDADGMHRETPKTPIQLSAAKQDESESLISRDVEQNDLSYASPVKQRPVQFDRSRTEMKDIPQEYATPYKPIAERKFPQTILKPVQPSQIKKPDTQGFKRIEVLAVQGSQLMSSSFKPTGNAHSMVLGPERQIKIQAEPRDLPQLQIQRVGLPASTQAKFLKTTHLQQPYNNIYFQPFRNNHPAKVNLPKIQKPKPKPLPLDASLSQNPLAPQNQFFVMPHQHYEYSHTTDSSPARTNIKAQQAEFPIRKNVASRLKQLTQKQQAKYCPQTDQKLKLQQSYSPQKKIDFLASQTQNQFLAGLQHPMIFHKNPAAQDYVRRPVQPPPLQVKQASNARQNHIQSTLLLMNELASPLKAGGKIPLPLPVSRRQRLNLR